MRERIQIMRQILQLCATPKTQTNIKRKTSLNHIQLKTYLHFLLSKTLLTHNSNTFVTTQKGHTFIDAIFELNRALESYTSSISNEVADALSKKEVV